MIAHSKLRSNSPVEEGELSRAASIKAGTARAAIDHQEGPREHAHRQIAAKVADPPPLDHQPPEVRLRAKRAELQEVLEKVLELKGRIASELLSKDEYFKLKAEKSKLGIIVHNLNGAIGSLNEEVARGIRVPHADDFQSRFVAAARLMLPPEVFAQVRAVAAKRVAMDALGGGCRGAAAPGRGDQGRYTSHG